MPICLDLSATIYIAIHRFRAVLITRLPSIRPEKGVPRRPDAPLGVTRA